MSFLSLTDASKAFNLKSILCKEHFSLQEGERVAVVGKNGSGKSTLLKIVLGECKLDQGQRALQNHIKINYLPQTPLLHPALSVEEAIEDSLVELKKAHQTFLSLTQALQDSPQQETLLGKYARVSAFLDGMQAWDLNAKVQEVLTSFGLETLRHRLVGSLSGGEQKRVALSQILFQSCDLLILDEPTNHLDVEMVEFLEHKLSHLKSTLLFICHDRYFIENLATRVVEVENGKLWSVEGGYSAYLKRKEELLHTLSQEHSLLLKLLKSEEEWLRRGVKARLKRNEGRKKRIMEMREKVKSNPSVIAKMKFELQRESKTFNQNEGKNNKKMLFEASNLSKILGEKTLFKDLNFRILQRDKIAFVGKNGSGKSTLLKVLLGEESPSEGSLKRGEVRIGYFDQHRSMLDENKNLLETFCPNGGDRVEVRGKNMHLFGYLKNFLFPKEYLSFKIRDLSGGERSRVALALLFTKEYDCLILDEPTNDLDISTINILEEHLQSFEGCILLVSHDRYFVDKIARKLFAFEGDGKVLERYESYTEYLEHKSELREYEVLMCEAQTKPQVKAKTQNKLSYKDKILLESLPQDIETLEKQIQELERLLNDPKLYAQKGITALASELQECQAQYEEKLELYFALCEKMKH